MSWFVLVARVAVAMAAASLFGGAGCSRTPAGCGNECPTATFGLRALGDTTVTSSLAGSAPHTVTGLVSGYPPAGMDCTFSFNKGSIFGPSGAGAEALLEGFSSLACGVGGQGTFDFIISGLGDFRDWSTGSFTVVATGRNFGVDFTVPGGDGCTVAYFDGLAMTAVVETATGGPAPYPQMVTGDFVRTFRLEFDTSSVVPTRSDGNPCKFPVAAQVSLHLTQAAADYVYDPNGACLCE